VLSVGRSGHRKASVAQHEAQKISIFRISGNDHGMHRFISLGGMEANTSLIVQEANYIPFWHWMVAIG
jgi:hypothetical protein